MTLENRINAFVKLGTFLEQQLHSSEDEMTSVIIHASRENAWFTEENIRFSLNAVREDLNEKKLSDWLAHYDLSEHTFSPKTIAVIMPGNIPLVGFRDFLAVLVSGHRVLCKLSSKDRVLLPYLAKKLVEIEPQFSTFISFEERIIKGFDAVIATGGNHAVEHFYEYFQKYPHLIRGHRNSCAILDGKESREELRGLFEDMFRYFGLGCRNVSKLFVPQGYDFQPLMQAAREHAELFHALEQHHLYQSNYQYQTVVSSLNARKTEDSGVFTLVENMALTPPLSVVNYEFYANIQDVDKMLNEQNQHLQCIISHHHIPFGKAQKPELSDYADGIDVMDFLKE